MQRLIRNDLLALITHWRIWYLLGTQDITLRYRRSSLGPFWITLSMAVTIYSMGFLYSHLFKTDWARYFPFLASGIIGWSFLSTLLLEATQAFIESAGYIQNQASYLSLCLMRVIYRNVIVFCHNLVVFIPIIPLCHLPVGIALLGLIPGLLCLGLNTLFWGGALAVIGTRYRDFQPIVNSLIQVAFFLTPIMWMPSILPERLHWIIDYNPFNHLLQLIRLPLFNEVPSPLTYLVALGITLLGGCLYAWCVTRYKSHIVFWL
jgi:ABC-type polysaccharide/polyol phosphate export permease